MEVKARNADDAFYRLVKAFHTGTVPTVETTSRAGDVIQATEPVTVTYTDPWECVLFNVARDCNPFFHLAEALWMLAGRRDVAFLEYFNPRMREFSDDGIELNGAYGYRWRHAAGRTEEVETGIGMVPEYSDTDQIKLIVDELQEKPDSRRCVLQMWNVRDDLEKIGKSKDVCCNTNVYFLVVGDKLEMTVCNRSNDLVWGMLGSNVVTFAFLQSYVAGKLRRLPGRMHQFTNNLHVYKKNWSPGAWLDATPVGPDDYYWHHFSTPLWALLSDPEFEADLRDLKNWQEMSPRTAFFRQVVLPMFRAFGYHKDRDYAAAVFALGAKTSWCDWTSAGISWLRRRAEAYRAKQQREQHSEAPSIDQG